MYHTILTIISDMDPYLDNSVMHDVFKKLPDDDPNMDRNM
jgi:hypothetical protein